jgi:hypothetical protein
MGLMRRDHGVGNTMVSSHQSHTWEQGPLYLFIQHHGLFSPILCMRPGTTLSVYTTSWSQWSLVSCMGLVRRDHDVVLTDRVVPGFMHIIGEKRPWCCIDRQSGPWSHECSWWEETMVLIPFMRTGTTLSVYATTWSLLTNTIHENRDHSICLCNTMVSSHPWSHE